MHSPAMIAVLIKDWIRESLWFQWLFSTLSIQLAKGQLRSGYTTASLDSLLRAWRSARRISFPASGTRTFHRILESSCWNKGTLLPISSNLLLRDFNESDTAIGIRNRFATFPPEDRVRLRLPRDDETPERQGNLIVLKQYNERTGERGVLLLKYGETFLWFAALFDLSRIAGEYSLVLEPCWSGYQDRRFLNYLGSDLTVVVQAPHPFDFDFISSLHSNLYPIRLGAGDWVDSRLFRPSANQAPRYDLVMVSSWNPVKRHTDLFSALKTLNDSGYGPLRIALVGSPTVWSRSKIESLIARYGLTEWCTVYENIPHKEVAAIVRSSKAFVLTSRQEGANKSLYEALFCDTPVLVCATHRSVNPDHIGPEVGIRFQPNRLHEGIRTILKDPNQFEPRDWAVRHTGWPVATDRLNKVLRNMEIEAGRPWTQDIVAKYNGPNLMYVDSETDQRFVPEYQRLRSRFATPM